MAAGRPTANDATFASMAPYSSASGAGRAAVTTASTRRQFSPGVYAFWCDGGGAADILYLAFGATNAVTAAEPAATADSAAVSLATSCAHRADGVGTLIVTPDKPWVAMVLSTGAAGLDVVFTRLV